MQGLDLNEQFFAEVLRPLLTAHFPNLPYSAARLGAGSDVLGYDDAMSTDHDWGIRQQLFLREEDVEWGTAVFQTLRHHLPHKYQGISVHFGPVAQQQLLSMTAGRVFYDGLGELEPLRQRLAYFPQDVWLYLMACQWERIGQEDHFMGRTGSRGDEIGSRLLASRLVHDVMMLGFLLERRYAPYPKWFGTAFRELACAPRLEPILLAVLKAESWQERELYLCHAFTIVGGLHNQLGITPPLPIGCEPFHGRPFQVHTGNYAGALRAAISDDAIRNLPRVGSIDQFSDNTDLRSNVWLFEKIRPLYE